VEHAPEDQVPEADVSDSGGQVPEADVSDSVDQVPRADVSDADVVDELPEDLDASEFVGPYTFPNNNRRRIPAAVYLAIGVACIGAFAIWDTSSPLVNSGTLWAGVGLIVFGVYGLIAGWTLRIDETEALSIASAQVSFAVGHASAQQVWRGWLSRPTWRILLYSAENPPARRGIVLLDGVSGQVVEWFAEDNPEDWSALASDRTKLTG
jgi:hypothetical protein